MDIERLNEAFQDFTAASKSLEAYYDALRNKIQYLTSELEIKNKQLGEALSDAERNKDFLKAVLYNLEEAIVVVDPEGRVSMMNRSAEKLLGTSHADALGKSFNSLDFTATKDGPETTLTVAEKRYSVIISRSDVVDAEGFLRGRVILIQDITRLRELETRHERNQRLIAMGEMAAKLVHEIRNPLCSIELYASMLEKEVVAPSQRELASGISAGIGNLNNILTNMLFFARPHKPSLKTLRLDAVIEESIRPLLPMMEARNVRVERSLMEQKVIGDAELFKQVFMNVLINAAQAMPDGGVVDVKMSKEGGMIATRVKDTGTGIPRENLEKIFDPFFTTKDTGTGLGLVIASNIMQANGGYIKAESEPGGGSVFSLYFPLGRNGTNNGRQAATREVEKVGR